MIDRTHDQPVVRQCQLLRLARSTVYYILEPTSPEALALMRQGFVYLITVIAWYIRKVLPRRLSNTLATDF